MTGRQIVRVLIWISALAFVFFVFLWIGMAVQSSRACRAGEKTLAGGDEIAAQAHFERSIRCHCPLNVWGKQSAERLEAMARSYEEDGKIERAISAYEALMTSLAAIDTGWSPSRRATIERLEQKALSLRREGKKTQSPAK